MPSIITYTMDTQDLLREAVLRIEKELDRNRESDRILGEAISRIDKHLGILETKVTHEARISGAVWGVCTAILFKIFSGLFSHS